MDKNNTTKLLNKIKNINSNTEIDVNSILIPNIPKHAKKVFSGVLFDIYQWKQELFDGSFKTFEIANMKDSVQIICITKDKKIILLNEEQPEKNPFLSLPGGGIDEGETIIEGAKRELMEELGMQAQKMIYFMKKGLTSKLKHNSFYFIAKDCEVVSETKLDGGEKIESFEVDFDEFVEYTQRDDFRNKYFRDYIFRIINTSGEKEKFKKMLFE